MTNRPDIPDAWGSAGASPSHERRHPAHGVLLSDDHPTIVFITVCTRDRRPWLATEETHALLREVWSRATAWLAGRYVLMPDHLHLFASPTERPISLDNWVRYWKSQFRRQHRSPAYCWQP